MNYNIYRSIPNNLRYYRKIREMTQLQVAQLLGFKDKTWISHWENGDALPNLINLIRLSKLYRVSIEDLFPDLVKVVDGTKNELTTVLP
jgi:transcriptional regulator with XRE-family HTH domain